MQSITPVTHAQLLALGQQPLMKLEAYVKGSWVDFGKLYSSEDLVGWWPFDEGSGMVAYDKSKYGNDGSLENMAEEDWVDGKVNKALDFDGENDRVDCENDVSLDITSAITLEAWVKVASFPELGVTVGKNWDSYFLGVVADQRVRFMLYIDGSQWNFYSNITLDAGTLYHIVATWRASDSKWTIYINGVQRGTGTATAGNISTNTSKVGIGSISGGASAYPFHGIIDEVRIYKRALTATEIKALSELKGKNYLETISMSLGGASMTPNPIGGTWSAMLSNEDSIFHPQHPNSSYIDWLRTGRKVRASVGATYGGTDYLWQRVIGYIDEPRFEEGNQKISISGADYMKLLQDTEFQELDATYPNHWGLMETFNSLPSDGLLGDEIYTDENDAMTYPAEGEADNVANWTPTQCTFVSFDDVGDPNQPSDYVGRVRDIAVPVASVKNTDVGTLVSGTKYKIKFKHRGVSEDGSVSFGLAIWQASGRIKYETYGPTDDWTEQAIVFTATDDGVLELRFSIPVALGDLRLDQISIFEYISEVDRYYDLTGADANQKGPYHVTYDDGGGAVQVQQGEEDEGWYYEEKDAGGGATGYVFFDLNKTVISGTNNVDIYYFTATHPEDAVARILWFAGLYASEALAKAAMDWDDPGFTIDKVWFKAGTTLLSAIKLLCERCDYRFYFKWDGQPVFKAKTSYSNLLTDGGLNLWDDATHLTEWSETVLGTSTINREATEKIEGAFSCRIDVDASNSLSYFDQSFSMIPLKRHKVVIWYMNSAVDKTARFRIKNSGNNVYLKEDGTWQAGEIYITLPNSIIWTPYELEFYAHADYSDYQILLRVLSAASSLIYFDEVSIWREEFTFTDQKHIASFSNYQCRDEIKNRVIVKGLKQAEPINRDDAVPSELIGEAHDDTSIAAYGERTLTITNHLFQTQDSIDHPTTGMCAILLARYKDPKWYTDIEVPYNPAPIELSDMIGWKERLTPTLELTQRGMVRDIKIDKYTITYKCEKH